MNASADPCEDFSQFACGRFYKEAIIPEDKENLGSFTYLGDVINERGRILLSEPINRRNDFEGHQKAKLYYKGNNNYFALKTNYKYHISFLFF